MKVKNRISLKKKEKIKIINHINLIFEHILTDDYYNKKFEELKFENIKIILIDNNPMIIKFKDNEYFFTIKGSLFTKPSNRRVFVDKNSVPFILNGADIMIPGIINIDEDVKINDYVIIVEPLHENTIAIGKMILSVEDIKNNKNGKAIKSLHYIGDDIWKLKI